MFSIVKVFPVAAMGAGLFTAAVYLGSCGTNTTEDSSVAGIASASVGAALSSTAASGTQSFHVPEIRSGFDLLDWVPDVYASGICPTLATTSSPGCVSGTNSAALTYSSCSFGTSSATWSGVLEVAGTGVVCGSFPTATVTRQFVVAAGGAAHTGTRTTSTGKVVTIDHSTADLGNYESDTISTIVNSGYGTSVTIAGGVRTGVVVKQRMSSTLFDVSVNGTLTVSETASASSRTVSGTVTTYHNLLKVKGTAVFSSVVYSNSCCTPVSGTIDTTLASTSASGAAGEALDGKTEKLVFRSCGLATATNTEGVASTVALTGCY